MARHRPCAPAALSCKKAQAEDGEEGAIAMRSRRRRPSDSADMRSFP